MTDAEPEQINLGEHVAKLRAAAPRTPEQIEEVDRINTDLRARREEQQGVAQGLARLDRFESLTPRRFKVARLGQVPEPAQTALGAWAARVLEDAEPSPNLLIAGPVGTGKTHASFAVVRELASRLGVWWTTEPDLLDSLRPGGPETALDRCMRAGLLMLDDVGAERPNEWTAGRLSLILDYRWREEAPVVATTNLALGPDAALAAAIGLRAYSRLVGSEAVVVRLTGTDRRRKQ